MSTTEARGYARRRARAKGRSAASWYARAGLVLSLLAGLPGAAGGVGEDVVVRIGALAYRGEAETRIRWSATAEYLSAQIPGARFEILPLDLQGMRVAIQARDVDFVLTNPGHYVALEAALGITRIVTLQNRAAGGIYTRYGAVIFTRADRRDIRKLKHLRGKTFMAVSPNAFGGFQMAWRRLTDRGIDPFQDLAELRFAGFPQDAIVLAVRDGRVDAATVRTDTLERMASEGKIRLSEFRVLDPRTGPDFPLLHSTRLYPEWPFAKARHTPEGLAKQVAQALLAMDPSSAAARASRSAGWTIPLDYSPVHELLKALQIGPYAPLGRISLARVLREYAYWLTAAAALFLLMFAVTSYVVRTNRRLAQTERALRRENAERRAAQGALAQHRDTLEQRVLERTRELERVNTALAADVEVRRGIEKLLKRNQSTLHRLHEITGVPGTDHEQRLGLLLDLGRVHFELPVGMLVRLGDHAYEVCLVRGETQIQKGHMLPIPASAEAGPTRSGGHVPVVSGQAPDLALRAWGRKAYLPAPVWVAGRLRYILAFVGPTASPAPGSSMDRDVLQLMAQWVGSEIERREAQETLQQHQAELAHVARLSTMGEMATGLAHELNQPLTAIVNYTSGCLRRLQGGQRVEQPIIEAMQRAVEGASRASEIVRHLREFIRKDDVQRTRFSINDVLQAVVRLVEREARQHNVALVLRLQEGLPSVEANRIQIEQVVLNLAKNAIEAGVCVGGEDPQVVLCTRLREAAIEVAVQDSGRGFPSAEAARLFEPFYTTKPDGMGMGLSISRSIVEAHGGTLEARSERGAGAEFRFTLPLTREG
jgi:two-component system sensor histidine kinase TtrS